jgi:hypothetical protein
MAKVDGAISSLIQGVSQQPERERLPGQCELQVNCSSDPVNGLKRRARKEYVASLIDSSDSYIFEDYDAGSLGHFIMAYKDDEIKVFNLDGTENTVTVESGADTYVPARDLKFIVIYDKIYLLDSSKETAMLSSSKSYVEEGILVFLLGGQYGRDYKVNLTYENAAGTENTITASVLTSNGGAANHIQGISTDKIALALYDSTNTQQETAVGFKSNATFNTNFDIDIIDDVLYIRSKSGADVVSYTATVEDGDGGSNIFVVNNQVKDAGEVPKYAPQGYIVKVSESSTSDADDWYLEFNVTDDEDTAVGSGFGKNGVWLEAVAPGIDYQIDPDTMPHVLEKTGPTAFTLKKGEWGERAVGDDETNPLPSFIGNTLLDILSFQGRLVLLSDVNLILSRPDKHTEFFNQSATVLSDDDPIDIASSLGTYILRSAVAHNRDLIVFSDDAQFILFGRNTITPKNSSLVLTTEFETDLTAKPVGAGRNIFFSFTYGVYSGIQEFFTEGGEDINDSRPITQHVLNYVRGTVQQLVSTTNFNKLVVRTDDDLKQVYVYEYVWIGREKAQSSWSKWNFSKDVKHMFFVDSVLYTLCRDGDDYELYTMDLDDTSDSGVPYRIALDELITRDTVTSTFTVPYTVTDIDEYVAVQGTGCPNPGLRAPISSFSSGTVTLEDDMGGGSIYFGRAYSSRYIPTTPYVRDRDGVKVGSGKLTIKHFVVHFNKTGYFDATIKDDFGYSAQVTYNGRVLGHPNNLIGEAAIVKGSYKVPYKKNAEYSRLEISSNSHLPFYITEMEWEGQFKKKGKRITGG